MDFQLVIMQKISDRSFELKGRVDDLRKINGHSVSLNEIQMVINMFPRIDQSKCNFVIDRNSGGYKIHARYTSKTLINQNKLIYFLRKRLETFKIPNRFTRTKIRKIKALHKYLNVNNVQKLNI